MKKILLVLLMMTHPAVQANETQSRPECSDNAQAFLMSSSDQVCGLHASKLHRIQLESDALREATLECVEEGFTRARLCEASFSVVPHSWGTIDCTPISRLSISAIKECF